MNLGSTYQAAKVFDPTKGAAPTQTLLNVRSIQIGVTGHPVIVEVEPNGTASGSAAPKTVTLGLGSSSLAPRIAEDAY